MRILIHAPYGRDGKLIHDELTAAGFVAMVCGSVTELCDAIKEGAAAALVGDEALVPEAVQCLADELAAQPPWSDFPLLVLTSGGAATKASRYRLALLEPLGNVTLLERPLRPETLISSLRTALRARRHQYQLREHLEQIEANEVELRETNEVLRRANRELEEFAYVASHDLQEPLRMVKIYTQLILERLDRTDPVMSQYADLVQRGGARMEELIRDLLSFSRAVHTESPPVGTADLPASLAEAVSVLKNRIEENGATISAQCLPRVKGDTSQFAHVFQNLLSNSLKYRQLAEAPVVHISAEQQADHWVLAIRDNGIGFEQQYAQRIFGLFKRLHKDEYPGTGLGLAICQRIVERFGGKIWATSEPGHGSTFYISLLHADAESA